MSNSDELSRVDEVMSDLGYKRIIAVKDHRTVERYEAPGKQLQNVSKQLAALFYQYTLTKQLEARLDVARRSRVLIDKDGRYLVGYEDALDRAVDILDYIAVLQAQLTTNKSNQVDSQSSDNIINPDPRVTKAVSDHFWDNKSKEK